MDRSHLGRADTDEDDYDQQHQNQQQQLVFQSSTKDEEAHRNESQPVMVVDVNGGCGASTALCSLHDNSNFKGNFSTSRMSATQRDRLGSELVQMFLPFGGVSAGLSSSTYRRRSGWRKGSVANCARHVPSKSNVYVIELEGDTGGIEMQAASVHLLNAFKLREKYKGIDKGQLEGTERLVPPVLISFESGVAQFNDQRTRIVPWEQFYDDVTALYAAVQHPACRRACYQRLQVLEEKHHLYKLCNGEVENSDRYRRGGGVFSNCTKVDNAVFLASCMNAEWLLEYIQETLERDSEEVVRLAGEEKEPQTLQSVCEQLDFGDPSQLTVDGLGLLAPNEKRLYRYDVLDPELNRSGRNSAEFLRLFLSIDTLNKGRYLAETVRPILESNDARVRNIHATESIMEITGCAPDEWDRMAHWVHEHGLVENRHNRWIIMLPRRCVQKESTAGIFEHHQQHLENLFLPLFLATLAPEDPKNIQLASFLNHVGGLMIVSDEEARENEFQRKQRSPSEVPWSENVCDLYFSYYFWANLCSLNAFRRRKGLNTLQFRSIAGGRSSQLDVVIYSYLLCDNVANALVLEHQPVLQYLYGMQRIGLMMAPLSNNGLGLPYLQNPFSVFFRRGLNVSLCTYRPLLFHHSKDAMIEEYGTASKLYQLSGIDVCEIALNSVMMSSFPLETKAAWLGESFIEEGVRGNVFELSKVPTPRLELRQYMWGTELQTIEAASRNASGRGYVAGFSFSSNQTTATAGQNSSVVQDPHTNFPRVVFQGFRERDPSHTAVAQLLHSALELRAQYISSHRIGDTLTGRILNKQTIEDAFRRDDTFDEDEWMFKTVDGVLVPHEVHQIPRLPKDMFHFDDFCTHIQELRAILDNIHARNFATRRLDLLEHKFMMHLALNRSLEAGTTEKKASQNRDFYQATKVDNNVRMETGMTARQLLNFIVSKANNSGDDIVAHQEGKEPQTLRQLLQELQISPNTLTVDDLNVMVDATLGVASAQYTPEGRDALLTLLLKTDNQMKGRYFAELTKLTFENFKHDRFTFTENRLPIYGSTDKEWSLLSDWFDTHGMASVHNQWMVQVPRNYGYLRKRGKVQSFSEYIENIFKPLWTVSLYPSKDPRLFHFINHISGFDSVEDERRPDAGLHMATKLPHEWTSEEDPPYNYYMYYMWANIFSLNEFRRRRNFSTFTFRPSCGEAGPVEHLIGGFLLAYSINYGVTLADDPVLQYLFYLARIGVTVSPLSNNTKVLGYLDNPFPIFFRRGLNVSLSTDSPLMFHHTQEPLLEEYSIASKVWKLGANDMCEIARNSVLLSGFDAAFKRERLGDLFFLSSSRSNDASRTHLSDIRVAYRFETYHTEVAQLEHISGLTFSKAFFTPSEESAREAEFFEAVQKKKEVPIGGIIDSRPEEVNLEKLRQHRILKQQQLEEINKTLRDLQQQNKQLSEKLAEERVRDQQAQQLRRRVIEKRWEEVAEVGGEKSSAVVTGDDLNFGLHIYPTSAESSADVGAVQEETPLEADKEEANRSTRDPKKGTLISHLPFSSSGVHYPKNGDGENMVGVHPISSISDGGSVAAATTTTTTTVTAAAATAALVGLSESMWSRHGNGNSTTASNPDVKNAYVTSSGLVLPPIISFPPSYQVTNNCKNKVENNSSLVMRPPTPPQRILQTTATRVLPDSSLKEKDFGLFGNHEGASVSADDERKCHGSR